MVMLTDGGAPQPEGKLTVQELPSCGAVEAAAGARVCLLPSGRVSAQAERDSACIDGTGDAAAKIPTPG